jgi:hypothetical protein
MKEESTESFVAKCYYGILVAAIAYAAVVFITIF